MTNEELVRSINADLDTLEALEDAKVVTCMCCGADRPKGLFVECGTCGVAACGGEECPGCVCDVLERIEDMTG